MIIMDIQKTKIKKTALIVCISMLMFVCLIPMLIGKWIVKTGIALASTPHIGSKIYVAVSLIRFKRGN